LSVLAELGKLLFKLLSCRLVESCKGGKWLLPSNPAAGVFDKGFSFVWFLVDKYSNPLHKGGN
jgi:hypothetical protein